MDAKRKNVKKSLPTKVILERQFSTLQTFCFHSSPTNNSFWLMEKLHELVETLSVKVTFLEGNVMELGFWSS